MHSPYRLAVWNTSYFQGFGGAEKTVNDLLNQLSKKGVRVYLIANRALRNQVDNNFFEPLLPNIKIYQDTFTTPWDHATQPFIFVFKLLQYLKASAALFIFLIKNNITRF